MPDVVQLVYYSRNMVPGDEAARRSGLSRILTRSRRNNLRDGLTGYLLFDVKWFVQILEGAPEAVDTAMSRIQADPHHTGLTLISRRIIRARSFPEWSMGGSLATSDNQAIFASHGMYAGFDPARLTSPGVIALAMDLQDHERSKRAVAGPVG